MMLPVFYCDHSDGPVLYISEPQGSFSRCGLKYLNEGGANVIFRICSAIPDAEIPSKLRGKLLRLRKQLPHPHSAQAQFDAFEQAIKPLFPAENLVQHELIALGYGFTSSVNDALSKMQRPVRRAQDTLPLDETHALLVTDMTPDPGRAMLQMKPKWLSQSANAPKDAKRCRTCALRARRSSQRARTATDAQDICSLSLVSSDREERESTAQRATHDKVLQHWLTDEAVPLLDKLRAYQARLDPTGVLSVQNEAETLNLCKAMTLRDCTLFVTQRGNTVDMKLADLDLKRKEKMVVWEETEIALIAKGWYTNTEDEALWSRESVCRLSRRSRAAP